MNYQATVTKTVALQKLGRTQQALAFLDEQLKYQPLAMHFTTSVLPLPDRKKTSLFIFN